MKARTTLVLLGVFVVLLAYVYFGEIRRPAPETATTPTPAPLWNLTRDDIVGVQVTSGDQEARLARGSDGTWTIEAPVVDAADETRVTPLLDRLASITPSRTFTDSVGSLEDYGLAQPSMVAVLQLTDGQSETLHIGAANPQGTAYYAQVEGSQPVYLIPDTIESGLQGLIDQPPVQPTPTPPPTETPAVTESPAATATPVATETPATAETPAPTETPVG